MSNNFIGSFETLHLMEFMDAVREAFPEDGDDMMDEIVRGYNVCNWEFAMSIETNVALHLINTITPFVTEFSGSLNGKKIAIAGDGKLSLDIF